jgi:hypothetical protein
VDGVVYVRGLFFQRTQVNAGYSSSLQAFSYHYFSTHLTKDFYSGTSIFPFVFLEVGD